MQSIVDELLFCPAPKFAHSLPEESLGHSWGIAADSCSFAVWRWQASVMALLQCLEAADLHEQAISESDLDPSDTSAMALLQCLEAAALHDGVGHAPNSDSSLEEAPISPRYRFDGKIARPATQCASEALSIRWFCCFWLPHFHASQPLHVAGAPPLPPYELQSVGHNTDFVDFGTFVSPPAHCSWQGPCAFSIIEGVFEALDFDLAWSDFIEWDLNGDAVITADETDHSLSAADCDADGQLTWEEAYYGCDVGPP